MLALLFSLRPQHQHHFHRMLIRKLYHHELENLIPNQNPVEEIPGNFCTNSEILFDERFSNVSEISSKC